MLRPLPPALVLGFTIHKFLSQGSTCHSAGHASSKEAALPPCAASVPPKSAHLPEPTHAPSNRTHSASVAPAVQIIPWPSVPSAPTAMARFWIRGTPTATCNIRRIRLGTAERHRRTARLLRRC